MFDIFKHPLTHISSIPKGCIEWLLVMLEQVLDVSKAFNLEDLWFLLNDFPETENMIRRIKYACPCFNFCLIVLSFLIILYVNNLFKTNNRFT